MAIHDITALAERVIASGGTEQQLLDCGRVQERAGTWTAHNGPTVFAVKRLLEAVEAKAARAVNAESAGARRNAASLGFSGEVWD